ncbi:hypothetical protein Tco_0131814 [Tanacetum coccineum]
MQKVTRHRAPIATKPRKEKNPSSTKPKLVDPADATKSLEASKSAEVAGNQPKTVDATERMILSDYRQLMVDSGNSRLCWIIPSVNESRPLYELYSLRLRDQNIVEKEAEKADDDSLVILTVEELLDEVEKQAKAD